MAHERDLIDREETIECCSFSIYFVRLSSFFDVVSGENRRDISLGSDVHQMCPDSTKHPLAFGAHSPAMLLSSE